MRQRNAVTWTHLHVGFGEVGDGRPLCNPALPVRDDLESEPHGAVGRRTWTHRRDLSLLEHDLADCKAISDV